MANFNTHLVVSSTASGLVATGLMNAQIATPKEVLLYFGMGTLGGLLPDLDSDNATILRVLFGTLAVLFSFLIMFSQADRLSLAELVVLWLASFVILHFLGLKIFTSLTKHRGMFHSIPAAVLFGLIMTVFCYYLLEFDDLLSWMCGSFVSLGYFSHLVLDELFSVDLANKKIKRSFGTALKFANPKQLNTTILVYLAIIITLIFAPSPARFLDTMQRQVTLNAFRERLLPHNGWFRDLLNR